MVSVILVTAEDRAQRTGLRDRAQEVPSHPMTVRDNPLSISLVDFCFRAALPMAFSER